MSKKLNEESPLRLRPKEILYKTPKDCICENGPKEIVLSMDETCNLMCKPCRNEKRSLTEKQSKNIERVLEDVVRPMLKDYERISVTSTGEFFAMKETQAFIKTLTKEEYPNLSAEILTNANLFTEEKWKEFLNLHEMPVYFMVSIDAATKETYEELRRGGNWERLCDAMELLSNLRKNYKIKGLEIRFIVQKQNYREMNKFVKLGEYWNVNYIYFKNLTNMGTYTTKKYKKIAWD